jgi:hypothetical protein
MSVYRIILYAYHYTLLYHIMLHCASPYGLYTNYITVLYVCHVILNYWAVQSTGGLTADEVNMLYYTTLYYTILYCSLLYYTVVYYTILCYVIQCDPILYQVLPYSTILHYTLLHYRWMRLWTP